ncbi:GNAT family N-acetyltransferase [Bacillaceae bacterium S4-13-56]
MADMGSLDLEMKSGRHYRLRSAKPKDAASILKHSRKVMMNTDFLLTTAEEMNYVPLKKEKEWIKSILYHPNKLAIIAEIDEGIIGFLDFHGGHQLRTVHQGEFGMSVDENFRGEGIGRSLVSTMIDWATAHPILEKINLEVFHNNIPAIHLYKSIGFEEEGRRKKQVKIEDEYFDLISMAKFL